MKRTDCREARGRKARYSTFEIRHQNSELPSDNTLPEAEEIHNQITEVLNESEENQNTKETTIYTQEEEIVVYNDETDHDGVTQVLDDSKGETPDTDDHFVDRATITPEHFDGEESVCRKCSFTFSTNENLTIHMINFHYDLNVSGEDQIIKGKVSIPISNSQSVESKIAIGSPVRTKSTIELREKKFECKKCPYKTYSQGNLKQHIDGVHDNIRTNKCL